MLLQATQRAGERPVPFRVDRGGQVRHLSHASDADPETVQPVHRRAFAGPAVSLGRALPFAGRVPLEQTTEAGPRDHPGSSPYRLTDSVEEPRLPFGSEKSAQEFTAGAGIIPQTGSVAVELVNLLAGIGASLDPLEEGERDVPVAYLSDEPGYATNATIERSQRETIGRGQKFLPNAEAGPEPAHFAMEAMQAFRGRVRVRDHPVGLPRDLGEDSSDLPGQPFRQGRCP